VTIAHAAKIFASVLGMRIGRNIHDVLKEDQLGLRSGKWTRDATGIRTTSDHRWGIVYLLQRHHKLDQINVDPKGDWYRPVRKDWSAKWQVLKQDWTKEWQEVWRLEEKILFYLYSEYLTKEALEGFRNFKIRQVMENLYYWLRQKPCCRTLLMDEMKWENDMELTSTWKKVR